MITTLPPTSPATALLVRATGNSVLEAHLAQGGHTLLHATSAAEALALAAAEDPDLVLLDVALPDEGARRICEALATYTESERGIVVESVTALTVEQRLEWMRLGAWDCLIPSSAPEREEAWLRVEWWLRARRATARERLGVLTDPSTGFYNRLGLTRRSRELGAQSFRSHEPIACVVFDLAVEPDSETIMASCARALHDEGRLSDIVARLSDREFVVLAAKTDEDGALHLAERMARAVRSRLNLTEGEAARVEIRAAWDSVPSLGYVPVQPIDMVIRAANAVRARDGLDETRWLRRSGGHATAPTESVPQ